MNQNIQSIPQVQDSCPNTALFGTQFGSDEYRRKNKSLAANIPTIQNSPVGRYAAPRPACSMSEVIYPTQQSAQNQNLVQQQLAPNPMPSQSKSSEVSVNNEQILNSQPQVVQQNCPQYIQMIPIVSQSNGQNITQFQPLAQTQPTTQQGVLYQPLIQSQNQTQNNHQNANELVTLRLIDGQTIQVPQSMIISQNNSLQNASLQQQQPAQIIFQELHQQQGIQNLQNAPQAFVSQGISQPLPVISNQNDQNIQQNQIVNEVNNSKQINTNENKFEDNSNKKLHRFKANGLSEDPQHLTYIPRSETAFVHAAGKPSGLANQRQHVEVSRNYPYGVDQVETAQMPPQTQNTNDNNTQNPAPHIHAAGIPSERRRYNYETNIQNIQSTSYSQAAIVKQDTNGVLKLDGLCLDNSQLARQISKTDFSKLHPAGKPSGMIYSHSKTSINQAESNQENNSTNSSNVTLNSQRMIGGQQVITNNNTNQINNSSLAENNEQQVILTSGQVANYPSIPIVQKIPNNQAMSSQIISPASQTAILVPSSQMTGSQIISPASSQTAILVPNNQTAGSQIILPASSQTAILVPSNQMTGSQLILPASSQTDILVPNNQMIGSQIMVPTSSQNASEVNTVNPEIVITNTQTSTTNNQMQKPNVQIVDSNQMGVDNNINLTSKQKQITENNQVVGSNSNQQVNPSTVETGNKIQLISSNAQFQVENPQVIVNPMNSQVDSLPYVTIDGRIVAAPTVQVVKDQNPSEPLQPAQLRKEDKNIISVSNQFGHELCPKCSTTFIPSRTNLDSNNIH